ncbi:hypothetical protein BO99DRAFT_404252 [Aspergillus violaceofuscus CBS 115571]|uniref:Tautomerase cis-CaaD-like domain-containing protein n=2 Tax=Aspergillus TaxID=5052 RepID=A0A2V5H926_ASPV1|nr:hypothetical protein BO99DRAFT_404252 [Aspergillus violaceofuscus CBS 115571]
MPKWVFHHTAGAFTPGEKQQIAQGMTKLYTSVGLPAFYAHAHFFELPPGSIFAGGDHPPALTTLSIYHLARTFETQEVQDMFFSTLDGILRPILKP